MTTARDNLLILVISSPGRTSNQFVMMLDRLREIDVSKQDFRSRLSAVAIGRSFFIITKAHNHQLLHIVVISEEKKQ